MKFIQLLLLITLFSCQNSPSHDSFNFFEEKLDQISEEPILNIYGNFNECGEWGGHEEFIKISKKNKNTFRLEFEKYSANCDSMIWFDDGIGYLVKIIRGLAA